MDSGEVAANEGASFQKAYEDAMRLQTEMKPSECILDCHTTLCKDICRDERVNRCFSNSLVKARILEKCDYSQGSANIYDFLYRLHSNPESHGLIPKDQRPEERTRILQERTLRWVKIAEWFWSVMDTEIIGEVNTGVFEYIEQKYPEKVHYLRFLPFVTTYFCLTTDLCVERYGKELVCITFFAALDCFRDEGDLHDNLSTWYPLVVKNMVYALCQVLGTLITEKDDLQVIRKLAGEKKEAICVSFIGNLADEVGDKNICRNELLSFLNQKFEAVQG